MSFQLEVHSPDRPRFAVVERIAAFISARGSLAISLDSTRILQCVQKDWLGVRLSETAFVWSCLGKTDLFIHVTFMRVFSFCFLEMLLCILDGSEYMFLVVRMWLSCFCRVVLSLRCCCHFPDDDASSRSGSRREESHEGSKLRVWGKHVASLLEHVVLTV